MHPHLIEGCRGRVAFDCWGCFQKDSPSFLGRLFVHHSFENHREGKSKREVEELLTHIDTSNPCLLQVGPSLLALSAPSKPSLVGILLCNLSSISSCSDPSCFLSFLGSHEFLRGQAPFFGACLESFKYPRIARGQASSLR